MDSLLYLALFLIVAILLVYLAQALLTAAKIGDPWRVVILCILVLGLLVFAARQLGLL